MFERYTETARRVIFFARYEASLSASQTIELEHLMLAILRGDRALAQTLFAKEAAFSQAIRNLLPAQPGDRPPIPSSVDLPLASSTKRALTAAAAESERLAHRYIGTEHLLLGALKAAGTYVSETLAEHRVTAEKVEAYALERRASLLPDAPAGSGASSAEPAGVPSAGVPGGTIGGFSKGYKSFEELATDMAKLAGLTNWLESYRMLLELLSEKGVLTVEEKDRLTARLGR